MITEQIFLVGVFTKSQGYILYRLFSNIPYNNSVQEWRERKSPTEDIFTYQVRSCKESGSLCRGYKWGRI